MRLWRAVAKVLGAAEPAAAAEPVAAEVKLVVGLGNQGDRYLGTRHNVGFEVVSRLAAEQGSERFRRQFNGRIARLRLGSTHLVLLKPETYMNLSGKSVRPAVGHYRLRHEQLLVVCDDLDLPVGKLRARPRGSDAGHRGLRSVTQELGTNDFPRLRIGIGSAPPGRDAADYVLTRFDPEEREVMDAAIARAAQAVLVWCRDGIEQCMNRFN